MAVDERLFVAGLLDRFDAAVDRKDRQFAIDIRGYVSMDVDDAAGTVDTIVSKQSMCGFPVRPEPFAHESAMPAQVLY